MLLRYNDEKNPATGEARGVMRSIRPQRSSGGGSDGAMVGVFQPKKKQDVFGRTAGVKIQCRFVVKLVKNLPGR